MVTTQFELNGSSPRLDGPLDEPRFPSAADLEKKITRKWESLAQIHARMDSDFDLYTLKDWMPDFDDPLDTEDIYTTNDPRVLAEKIIAFITATERIIVARNDEAQDQQEQINDMAENLAVGMLENADRHLERNGDPRVQDQLAHFTVVRGRYAAARAFLRKRPNGDTFEDILPLDPRNLVIQQGDGELKWAAYRMRWTAGRIQDEFPGFEFAESMDSDQTTTVWEYFSRENNPEFDFNGDPFTRHPFIYLSGIIIDSKWARQPHDLHMLSFPVVVSPVTAQPELAPVDRTDTPDVSFGESVFAENRGVWKEISRTVSQINNLANKAVDPRTKVTSLDGTKTLDDGASDPGAEINLSTANQEDVENFQEADISNAVVAKLNRLQQEAITGGLPPQSFGILDKPLSAVALRQLGNNLEHRVLPRMRAVASCLEGCIENMMSQYETGAWNPITASGRRYDNHRFFNRVITPDEIQNHDPVEVRMDLALPEDEVSRWTVAQIAMTPTPSGEPLADLEFIRERILKIQSHNRMSRRNFEAAANVSDPVAQAMNMFTAALREGNMALAAIWFDKLQVLHLQTQVQGRALEQQLLIAAQGLPIKPLDELLAGNLDLQTVARDNNQSANPANGAPGVAERRGAGNTPSPEAGFNTTASRNRSGEDTGLIDTSGNPITFQ